MRYHEFQIAEALLPSEYRPLMKGWDRERYKDIFTNPKYKHDRNGYRVFIPFEAPPDPNRPKGSIETAIEQFLNQHGYDVVDYIKGIALERKQNRNIKIAKALNKIQARDKSTPLPTIPVDTGRTTKNMSLADAFNTDNDRKGTQNQYLAVISRHPYDIGGMTTDRSWESCMNLRGGFYRHYVPIDIKEGTVIAYATRRDDPDLKSPTGRVLLKPFIDVFGKPVVHFGIENRTYGTIPPGFIDTVTRWVDEVNQSRALDDVVLLKMNPKLYADSSLASQVFVAGKNLTPEKRAKIQGVRDDPESILDMENPSEMLQRFAVYRNPRLFLKLLDRMFNDKDELEFIEHTPPESVQRLAVAKNPRYLGDIIDVDIKPAESVQLAAIRASNSPYPVELLLDNNIPLSEKVILAAIEKHPSVIGKFHRRGYKLTKPMLKAGVIADGNILDWYFENDIAVDLDIIVAAVDNGYQDIYRIFKMYQQKNQKMPDIIMNTVVKSEFAGSTIAGILELLKDGETIPISEKQLVTAIITDYNDNDFFKVGLISKVARIFPKLISEKTWIKLLIKTEQYTTLQVKRLVTAGAISTNGVRQLLKYNGGLLGLIEKPTRDEIYAAQCATRWC